MARITWLELWNNLQERLIRKEVWTREELVRLMNKMEAEIYKALDTETERKVF